MNHCSNETCVSFTSLFLFLFPLVFVQFFTGCRRKRFSIFLWSRNVSSSPPGDSLSNDILQTTTKILPHFLILFSDFVPPSPAPDRNILCNFHSLLSLVVFTFVHKCLLTVNNSSAMFFLRTPSVTVCLQHKIRQSFSFCRFFSLMLLLLTFFALSFAPDILLRLSFWLGCSFATLR